MRNFRLFLAGLLTLVAASARATEVPYCQIAEDGHPENGYVCPGAGPKVGIHYLTWFEAGCTAWGSRFGVSNVEPVSIESGTCYGSDNESVATAHAALLHKLGVDFVLFDLTNTSKFQMPEGCQSTDPLACEFKNARHAMTGFTSYTAKKIQAAFILSLTCIGIDCFGQSTYADSANTNCKSGHSGENEEIFAYQQIGSSPDRAAFIKAHIEAIAQLDHDNPGRMLNVDGKPLLLFYVSGGNNVKSNCNSLSPKFNGPQSLYPTANDFDPDINVPDLNNPNQTVSVKLRSHFTVRFAVVNAAAQSLDYTWFDQGHRDIWPYRCDFGCTTYEASETALASLSWTATSGRSLNEFIGRVRAANEDSSPRAPRPYLLIRSWNEFSGTDENVAWKETPTSDPKPLVWTIEPNNTVQQYDDSPLLPNSNTLHDPWYYYNQIAKGLSKVKTYRIQPQHLSVCLDVDTNWQYLWGAKVQQFTCLGTSPYSGNKNQVFYVQSLGAGDEVKIVEANHGTCLDVLNGNTQIQQFVCYDNNVNQTFKLVPAGAEDVYHIKSKAPSPEFTKCLAVPNSSPTLGTQIELETCGSGSNQKWKLDPVNWPVQTWACNYPDCDPN